jgi:uncharacterized protein YjbI with pentapeptide repeats
MSISLTISGEIIESQNYLSNYFVTLNGDQTINGIKKINYANISSLNVSQMNSSNIITSNLSTITFNSSNISTSNISTGTLNSNNINTNNISTNNLSTGTLNSSNIITTNMSSTTLNASTMNVKQINVSSLDISTTFTFNGANLNDLTQTQIYGSNDISSNLVNGTIAFGKSFDTPPCVVISQYSNRIVPICITNITTTNFNWAASSSNVGKIIWSAGIKFNN